MEAEYGVLLFSFKDLALKMLRFSSLFLVSHGAHEHEKWLGRLQAKHQ